MQKGKKAEVIEEKPKPRIAIDPERPIEDQVPLNALPSLFPNVYEAIVAAAKRARQINVGLKPLVKTGMTRPVDIAMAELAAAKVTYEVPADENKPDLREPKAPRKKR